MSRKKCCSFLYILAKFHVKMIKNKTDTAKFLAYLKSSVLSLNSNLCKAVLPSASNILAVLHNCILLKIPLNESLSFS